ncbi:hypothetical protein DMUE_2778 [Dictyocoela muelleri]|nr:hypothetical protein DMUE_2778 [Dictyocoela muelleri]
MVKASTKLKPSDIAPRNNRVFTIKNFIRKKSKSNQISHTYKIGDEILIKNQLLGKLKNPFVGPFPIVKISNNNNQRVLYKGPKNVECRNIKSVKPYWRGDMSHTESSLSS